LRACIEKCRNSGGNAKQCLRPKRDEGFFVGKDGIKSKRTAVGYPGAGFKIIKRKSFLENRKGT